MERYYLHLRDGQDLARDEEGSEFDTLASLRAAMLLAARDIMAGDVVKGRLDLNLRIDAETATGDLVLSMPFTSALRFKDARPAA